MKMFKIISAIVLGLVAAVILFLPQFTKHEHPLAYQVAAISTLRTIHNSQAQFKAINGRFGSLKELVDMGLIGPNYAAGKPISQFIYTDASVSLDSYCVCANRVNDKAGNRDFNIIEDGEIRFHESETKSSAICGKGQSLTRELDSK